MTGSFLSQCSTIGLTVYIYSYIVSTVKVDFQLGILVTAEVSGGHFNPTIRSRKQWNDFLLFEIKTKTTNVFWSALPGVFAEGCRGRNCQHISSPRFIALIDRSRPPENLNLGEVSAETMFFQFLGSALAVLLVLVVYWEQADKLGVQLGLGLASFPGLVNLS